MLAERKMIIGEIYIEFLGMCISKGQYQLQPHIATQLDHFSDENLTFKQVQQFLGIVNYMAEFILDLVKYMTPLTNQLKKDAPSWNQACTDVIKVLNKELQERESFTDASDKFWGAVLFEEENGKRQICVKYTPQYRWLAKEFERVDRDKTPWLIVLMHVPIYNSNEAHFMEGESMRTVYESWFIKYKVDMIFAGHVHAYERSYRISNIRYNVSEGHPYPIPDKGAPVYITVGDGGNQEGLASRFREPQPDYSAFRESSYGHSTLEIKNRTHALYHWNRNDEGKKVETDSFMIHNQYWGSNGRRRKLKKKYLYEVTKSRQLNYGL
ncbi:Acid phosphatase [Heracleum sosnowskyi]|uniref:acid phosphatase n=1 Tax=Heracleum sosnowskyi TaxID=360622 RepID=A0AAD8IXE5_9APIA|nr:Acid phosphatase [Heracleum sosnowskyi]